jgi:DamX protein
MMPGNQDTTGRDAASENKDPFSAQPDPQFYFAFDAFEKRLAMLASLVEGRDVIVLVIGEPGSGKTTLLDRYLQKADAPWKVCRIHYSPAATPGGGRVPGKDRGFAAYVLQDAAEPVIIVDDAHRLDRLRLRFLLKEALVPGRAQKIKRLVLFGPPDLYTAVNAVSKSFPTDAALNKIYLPGLSREETAAYIEHRLTVAGYPGKNPFKGAVINKIYQTTGGIPGAINKAARSLLEKADEGRAAAPGFLQWLKNFSGGKLAWTLAGGLVILLAALWFYPDGNRSKSGLLVRKPAARVFRAKIKPGPDMVNRIIRVKIPPVTSGTQSQRAPEAAPKTGPAVPSATPKDVSPPAVPPKHAKKVPAVASFRPKPIPSPSAAAGPPAAASMPAGALHREKWLLSQNPMHYTIQILGVRNEKTLREFVRQNHLEKQRKLAFYRGTYKGKDWYRLLYGIFTTQQEARLTTRGLPAQVQRTSPWVRRLSSVQRDIRD